MKINIIPAIIVFFVIVVSASAQSASPASQNPPNANPMEAISTELSSISKSVKTLNQNMKIFLDKVSGGPAGSDKQQKLLVGLQILTQAEQRLAALQKLQIDLVEKQIPAKARIIQIEQDLRPESIDRSATFLGTTKTDEYRDNRRKSLETERLSLAAMLSQVESTLAQTSSEVREAQALVLRLRRQFLPQIDQQITELQEK
jgi:hypothetical protein